MGCTALQGAITVCGRDGSLVSVKMYELAYSRAGKERDEAHGFV
jgi:hypothetical protein